MAEVIIMPKLGFNMDQGKIISWFKSEGDQVEKGEPLFSIETDKTVIDIEATHDGIVRKILAAEGDTLDVTLPIAVIGAIDEDIDELLDSLASQTANIAAVSQDSPEDASVSAEKSPVPAETSKNQKVTGMLKITPRARKFSRDRQISPDSLPGITGTGFEGGICEKDLIIFLETTGKIRATPLAKKIATEKGADLNTVSGTGPKGKITRKDILNLSVKTSGVTAVQTASDGREILEKIPYSGIRKVIGDRLSESKFTAPHLYFTQKVNMEKLLEVRKEINSELGIKTSVTDFISKAVVIALSKFPDINSSLINGNIEKYKTVNLGIAVAAPSGLIVPNIKNSEEMNVIEIAEAAAALIGKAREGKLSPKEYAGGTFTISNLGMFGIENFTAIINPPESAILAVSSTKDEPWVVVKANGEKTLEIKPVMNINLTVDHRLIDGLIASQFATEIKNLLEHPVRLII